MVSVFDINHDPGHSLAGLLGVGGFPIAALLLSVSLGHNQAWQTVKKPLLWVAGPIDLSCLQLLVGIDCCLASDEVANSKIFLDNNW